jgi:hypothetical protein
VTSPDDARLREIEERCEKAASPTHDELRPLYSGLAPQPDGPRSEFDCDCYFSLGALARIRDEFRADVPYLLVLAREAIALREEVARLRTVAEAAAWHCELTDYCLTSEDCTQEDEEARDVSGEKLREALAALTPPLDAQN